MRTKSVARSTARTVLVADPRPRRVGSRIEPAADTAVDNGNSLRRTSCQREDLNVGARLSAQMLRQGGEWVGAGEPSWLGQRRRRAGISHVGAAGTPSQARLQSPLLLQTRVGAVLTRGMLYFLRQVGANAPTRPGRVQRCLLQGWEVNCSRRSGALRPHARIEPAKYSLSPIE